MERAKNLIRLVMGILVIAVAFIPVSAIADNGSAGVGVAKIIGVLILLSMMFMLYFLPAFVARNRGHRNKTAITVLNLFTGWTFVGWIVALVWSFTTPIDNRIKSS